MCLTADKIAWNGVWGLCGVVGVLLYINWRRTDARGVLPPLDLSRDVFLFSSVAIGIVAIDPWSTRGILPWEAGHLLSFIHPDVGFFLMFYLKWQHMQVSTRVMPSFAKTWQPRIKKVILFTGCFYYLSAFTMSILFVTTGRLIFRDFRVLSVSASFVLAGVPETFMLLLIRSEVVGAMATCPPRELSSRKAAVQRLERLLVAILTLMFFSFAHALTTLPILDFDALRDDSRDARCGLAGAAESAGALLSVVGWVAMLAVATWKTTHRGGALPRPAKKSSLKGPGKIEVGEAPSAASLRKGSGKRLVSPRSKPLQGAGAGRGGAGRSAETTTSRSSSGLGLGSSGSHGELEPETTVTSDGGSPPAENKLEV